MKFVEKHPPRRFAVGKTGKLEMSDCGTVALAADEQVTFVTESGAEYDVARKNWGFYATPSLNGRLQSFALRGALIRNTITGRYFVLLVERGREDLFNAYRQQESLEVVTWLDSTESLDRLRARLGGGG
jgi:hypothetical protein